MSFRKTNEIIVSTDPVKMKEKYDKQTGSPIVSFNVLEGHKRDIIREIGTREGVQCGTFRLKEEKRAFNSNTRNLINRIGVEIDRNREVISRGVMVMSKKSIRGDLFGTVGGGY